MVDTLKPPKGRRQAMPSPEPVRSPKPQRSPSGSQSSAPVFIVALVFLLLAGGGIAGYVWWETVQASAVTVWEALRWTYVAAGALAIAFAAVLRQRRDLVTKHPNYWASALLMVPVVAGSLQLSGQGLGGEFGGWLVGSSAAWGIARTAAIFTAALAVAAPIPAYFAGRLLLIGLGFLAVYAWDAMGHVLRWAQAAGVWIGIKCTEVSPSVSRAVASFWRGVCAVYRRVPVHVVIVFPFVFIGSLLFGRSSNVRRRRGYSPYDAYLHPGGIVDDEGAYGSAAATMAARPAPAASHEPPAQPGTSAESEATASAYRSPSFLLPNQRTEQPAPPPAHAGNGYAPPMPAAADPADEDGDDAEFSDELDEDVDSILEVDDEDVEIDDDEEDDFADIVEPEVIDLRSTRARSGGLIGHTNAKWELPKLDLLKSVPVQEVSEESHHATARLIEQTLGEYGIEVAVREIRPGPVVTQYGVVPGWIRRYKDVRERNPDGTPARGADGKLLSRRVEEKTRVRVDHVLAREKDLALALAAETLRFEPSVPGQSYMGLEVPNTERSVVTLRSSLESSAFEAIQKKAKLPIALGLGSGGEPVIADLAEMPHLLIAGSTGSGKSVCMNVIICSLMMQCTPLDLQMYLVDPKRVELTGYNGLPHLAGPVLVEVDQAVPALHALIAEMQSRYKRFEARGARNIVSFNSKLTRGEERMPHLLLIIDELADLMMTVSGDVEPALCRLAQLGRAAGIHLVIATQRPSVNVITGLIKANFPSRISFKVSSQVDARTVLDGAGAEKLLGRGDLLFMSANAAKPKRLQGAFISDEEVDAIVDFWRKQGNKPKPTINMEIAEPDDEEDTMVQEAQRLAINHSRISASLLQRKLGVGYAKAASLLDHLEDRGIVGPGDPGKSREVITPGS